MNQNHKDTAAESQRKDFNYVARLAQEMRRAAPSSYSDEDDQEPVVDFSSLNQEESISLESMSSIIDTKPGTVSNDPNEIGSILQDMRDRSDRFDMPVDPYDSALRFGEQYLGLNEDNDKEDAPSLTDRWSLTPTQTINGIDDALRTINASDRAKAKIMTNDGRKIVDIIIKNGNVILIMDGD